MDLNERLAQAERSDVIRDSVRLIDEEVGRKSGVTGMALKAGYKVVKKLRSGRMIDFAVNHLLDDFTGALAPMYDSFVNDDAASTFESYVSSRKADAADALLAITDGRIGQAENRVIVKTYDKLRGQAKKHVEDAVPGVGRLIDKHAPKE